jgi:hypothetical protein
MAPEKKGSRLAQRKQVKAFKPFTERGAACIRQEWEATFPRLTHLLNHNGNQPPVKQLTLDTLSIRDEQIQRGTFDRGGPTKNYDLEFGVKFEDGVVSSRLRSLADLVREVGRVWRLEDTFVSDVIEGNEQWVSVHAVNRQVVNRAEQRRSALAAQVEIEGTKEREGKKSAAQEKKKRSRRELKGVNEEGEAVETEGRSFSREASRKGTGGIQKGAANQEGGPNSTKYGFAEPMPKKRKRDGGLKVNVAGVEENRGEGCAHGGACSPGGQARFPEGGSAQCLRGVTGKGSPTAALAA